MTPADGQPEILRWCKHSAPDRTVCRVSSLIDQNGMIVGFQRLIADRTTGK